MPRKAKFGNWIPIVGVILLILGAYTTAFVSDTSGHLKIYFSIVGTSLKILEASPEFSLPLAGIQPYIQNLTSGTRSLTITAFVDRGPVLNQTITRIGEGYDVRRTPPLKPSPASNANVTLVLKLMDGSTQLSEAQIVTPWGQNILWQTVGIALIVLGAVLVGFNLRLRAKKTRKKARDRKRQENSLVQK